MKISEAIAGLAQTLRDKGDLDIWFCVKDYSVEGVNSLKSLPMVSGGWVNNAEGFPVAFLSPENLDGVVPNAESVSSDQ